jgi:hypothetical protein
MPNLLLRAGVRHEILDTSDDFSSSNASRGLPMDLNVTAFRIVQKLTTENKEDTKRSSAASVAGRVGGPARARKLSPERQREIALKANQARWKQKKA